MKKVAVTGALASGKSTTCQLLKGYGAYVVSADEIVHNLLNENSTVRKKIVEILGDDVLINNQLNRKDIARKVFSQPKTLRALEKILHPLVLQIIFSTYERIRADTAFTLFVAEIPLLYETASDTWFDATVLVTADEDICRKRFYQTCPSGSDTFTARMNRQMSVKKKKEKAHFIIPNNGDLSMLQQEVKKLFQILNRLPIHKGDSQSL